MREIIFDTETTGLSHAKGDRVIEIGAIEMINKFPTGNIYHQYINSEGFPIHPDALKVHGINEDFLKDKPLFAAIADEFIEFFSNARLVAHNAPFDIGFVNSELKRIDKPQFTPEIVIDTLAIAKRKHPMGPNSLDALCKRYSVDNSHRQKHGALLDAELLAEVYIELLGGKQASLELVANNKSAKTNNFAPQSDNPRAVIQRPKPLASPLDDQQKKAHKNFIADFGVEPLWNEYD